MPAFKKPKKNGRPSILTEKLIEAVVNCMRAGAYIETAVVVSGASKESFYEWMKIANGKKKCKDKELHELCIKFLHAVERAFEEATMRDLQNIDRAAMGQDFEYERYAEDTEDPETGRMHKKGSLVLNGRGNPIVKKVGQAPDWGASAWRLERRAPKQWGRNDKILEINNNNSNTTNNNMVVEFVDFDEE